MSLVVSAVGLTACSNDGEIRPHENTTLRIGVAGPRAGPTIGISGLITNLAHEPLVSVGWDGRPTSKLAASWQWSRDGREVRFELEPNVKFHDGTAFTAAHARDALLPRLKDTYAQRISISYSSVEAVEAKDDRTIVIRLAQPEAFFLADLMNTSLSHPQNPALGTGPFRREVPAAAGKESTRQSTRLIAFDDYYRGKPGVDTVEIVPYDEQRTAWAAFMRGDIDAVHEASPNAMDFVERQKTVRTYSMTRPYYMHLLFNLDHPDLKKAGVRQALSHAVDRQAIIASALNGRGFPADSPLWPQHWAYVEAPRRYGYNTEAARLLLDRAGYPVSRPKTGSGAPNRFEFNCLTVANDARFEKIALLVQKQLHDIGVEMHVEAVPLEQLGQRMAKGNFDALLIELTSGRSLTWAYTTYHSTTAPGKYHAADAVLERLRRARTDSETRQGVSDLLQILYDDPPAVFIAWPQVARAVSTKFIVPEEAGRDVLGSLWKWKAAPHEPLR